MTTNNRFEQVLEDRINAAIERALEAAGLTDAPALRPAADRRSHIERALTVPNRIAAIAAASDDASGEPVARRKRRHFKRGATVAYVVNPHRFRNNPFPESMSTHHRVWEYINSRKAAPVLTNEAIEQGTGLGKKTVQSVVWFMRNHKIDGNEFVRINPGKKALVASAQADRE